MTRATPTVTPAEVLAFWFGSTDATDPRWFKRSDAFDAAIRERFGTTVESALAGRLDGWAARPPSALALVEESELVAGTLGEQVFSYVLKKKDGLHIRLLDHQSVEIPNEYTGIHGPRICLVGNIASHLL